MGADKREKLAEGHAEADKAALEAKPNEARMSAVAKRLLATKPDHQSTGMISMNRQKGLRTKQ